MLAAEVRVRSPRLHHVATTDAMHPSFLCARIASDDGKRVKDMVRRQIAVRNLSRWAKTALL